MTIFFFREAPLCLRTRPFCFSPPFPRFLSYDDLFLITPRFFVEFFFERSWSKGGFFLFELAAEVCEVRGCFSLFFPLVISVSDLSFWQLSKIFASFN